MPVSPPRSFLKPAVAALVVFLFAAIVAASVIWRMELGDLHTLRQHATIEAATHAGALQRSIDRSLSATYALAALVRQGNGDIRDFDAIASTMLTLYPGASSLQLAPRGIVQRIVPLAGNERAIGHDLLKDPTRTRAAFLARDTGKLTLDGPFDLVQGGLGAVGRLPVFLDDANGRPSFWGFTSVLIGFPQGLEATHLFALKEQGLAWELWRTHPDTRQKQVIAASSSAALIDPVETTLQVPNTTWNLSLAPLDGWHNSLRLSIRAALGLLFGLVLAYLAKLLAELRVHRRELEALVARRTAEVVARETALNHAQAMARIGSWEYDQAKNEFRGSAELARIYGVDESVPLSYDFFLRRVHTQDRETVDRAWQTALKGDAHYDIEYRITVGAQTRWVHSQAELTFGADGTLRRAIGTVQEITERKQREENLWRFRLAMDSTADAIYLVDRTSMRFVDINAAACTMRGQTREEMLALGPAGVLSVSRTELERTYDAVISGGIATEPVEMLRERKDGTKFWVEIQRCARQFGEDWTIVTVVRDISERKRSEEALRAAEEQFRGLVEQSITGIYIIQDGRFAYVNPRFAEIRRFDAVDELIGRDPMPLIAEKDRETVAEINRRLLAGEARNISYGFTALCKDGSAIEVGIHGTCATYRGRPAIIGMLQDISEKKRAEDQIRRYNEQLKTAFMSAVVVATTLSEIRDPYTSGHARRVGVIAAAIGAELGFDTDRQEGLRVAGHLHDIGKIAIPVGILSKPGKLNPIEFQLIQGHSRASYDVLKGVEFPWPVAEIALQHHERMDGSGYPQGLKGEAILLDARIMAVADVVEAMSSHRPYRAGLGIDNALAEIKRGRGGAYDNEVVDACLRLFCEKHYQLPA